jgi:hypothetical protein
MFLVFIEQIYFISIHLWLIKQIAGRSQFMSPLQKPVLPQKAQGSTKFFKQLCAEIQDFQLSLSEIFCVLRVLCGSDLLAGETFM